MNIVPHTHQQRQVAIPDGPALRAAYQHAQERILVLEQENATLRQEIRWTSKLLAVPASVMSPSQKVTLHAAATAIQRSTPNADGLVQIESWKLCQTVGQSKDTFLDNLTYLSENVGALRKHTQRIVSEEGAYTTNLYIGGTDLIARPEQYRVEKPRNHGGERLTCPHCHSDRIQKKVTVTCMSCGSVLNEKASQVNQNQEESGEVAIPGTVILQKRQDAIPESSSFFAPPSGNLTTNITIDKDRQLAFPEEIHPVECQMGEQEPVSPPLLASDDATPSDLARLMQEAVALLVEIAGPEPVHIEMSARGPAKYYEVKRPFELADARAHLAGKKTKGAMLRRPDGTTRALCYDADTDEDWLKLRLAAHLLADAGYVPLVEDSPAGRGGHLWTIYSDLVDARSAQRHVCEIAPMLQEIKEFWPSLGNHKVRLPGGKYVKPGFSQQCKLYDGIGGLVAETRQEVALALLTMQTVAGIIPNYPPDPAPAPEHYRAIHQIPESEFPKSVQRDPAATLAHGTDACSQAKGNAYRWFQFTPQQLATWYNERHSIEELLPPEHNHMGLAHWRGERTASVGYTKDGQGWVDFGGSARRGDGKQDGGDALELEARLSDQSKPEVMRQAARDLIKEARAALESAARASQQPPAWVRDLLTPAGQAQYQKLLQQFAVHPLRSDLLQQVALPSAEAPSTHTGGLTVSCVAAQTEAQGVEKQGPYPAPKRASICCGAGWAWSESKQQYVCSGCLGRTATERTRYVPTFYNV